MSQNRESMWPGINFPPTPQQQQHRPNTFQRSKSYRERTAINMGHLMEIVQSCAEAALSVQGQGKSAAELKMAMLSWILRNDKIKMERTVRDSIESLTHMPPTSGEVGMQGSQGPQGGDDPGMGDKYPVFSHINATPTRSLKCRATSPIQTPVSGKVARTVARTKPRPYLQFLSETTQLSPPRSYPLKSTFFSKESVGRSNIGRSFTNPRMKDSHNSSEPIEEESVLFKRNQQSGERPSLRRPPLEICQLVRPQFPDTLIPQLGAVQGSKFLTKENKELKGAGKTRKNSFESSLKKSKLLPVNCSLKIDDSRKDDPYGSDNFSDENAIVNSSNEHSAVLQFVLKRHKIIRPELPLAGQRRTKRNRIPPVRRHLGERALYHPSPSGNLTLKGVSKVVFDERTAKNMQFSNTQAVTFRNREMRKARVRE